MSASSWSEAAFLRSLFAGEHQGELTSALVLISTSGNHPEGRGCRLLCLRRIAPWSRCGSAWLCSPPLSLLFEAVCRVAVCLGPVAITLLKVSKSPASIGPGIFRVQADGFVVVRDGPVVLLL